jgi:hypothetical protein
MELLTLWLNGESNVIYLNLYTIVEYTILSILIYTIAGTKILRSTAAWLLVIFLIFSILNLFYLQGFDSINSISLIVECLLCITLFGTYLVESIHIDFSSWISDDKIIASILILFYFSSNFFVFGFSYLYEHHAQSFHFDPWIIHSVSNIIFHLGMSVVVLISAFKWKLK